MNLIFTSKYDGSKVSERSLFVSITDTLTFFMHLSCHVGNQPKCLFAHEGTKAQFYTQYTSADYTSCLK